MRGIKSSTSGRPFNLSISSFSLFFLGADILPRKRIVLWLLANNWVPQFFLFLLVVVCILITLRQAYLKGLRGFNPYVFLACSIGACVIPSISFDYRLSMLPACVAISIPEILSSNKNDRNLLTIFLTFAFAVAYSSMLYSYVNKPEILQNNFPALLIILIVCTIFSCGKAKAMDSNAVVAISEDGIN